MLIYRLEDETGLGVFKCHPGVDCLPNEQKNHAMDHPDPFEDGPSLSRFWRNTTCEVRESYVFGFQSEAQMRDWFPDDALTTLQENGIRISKYYVPMDAVVIGVHQVIFKRGKARLIV